MAIIPTARLRIRSTGVRSARGVSCGARLGDAAAPSAPEAEQVQRIGPRVNSALARPEVITRFECDRLDAPSQWHGAQEQIDIDGPHRTLDDRLVTDVT